MGPTLSAVLDDARRRGFVGHRPVAQTGGWQPGDERFALVTARRPVLEAAVATVAAACPGLRIRRGVRATGLLSTGGGAVPRVVGVRAGSDDVSALTHNESVSLLTLPADNGTWGVGITTSSRDRELRALRHVSCWEAAMRCYPATSGWIDAEPITGISHRLAEIEADVVGVPYQPEDPGWAMTRALSAGGRQDPVVARALATIASVLGTAGQVLGDGAVFERVSRYLGRPHFAPGADRAELLSAVRRARSVL